MLQTNRWTQQRRINATVSMVG